MLKIIGIVIVVAIAGILIFASTQPDTFRIQRTLAMKASPAKIFPHVNDLQKMQVWSPWEKMDSNMKRTYTGPTSGQNAEYAWDGNKNVGAGKMKIIESIHPSKVTMSLDFLRPMEGHNVAEFSLVPRYDGMTDVTWAMSGPSPFLSKVICTFMNMDKMVGSQFEKGLAELKTIVESPGVK
jgi:hypothetical protein